MTAQTDANDVLMGASGPPAAKFAEPGTTWEGQIVSPPHGYQLREYDKDNPGGGALRYFPKTGDPIMGVTVDIQTSDRDVAYDNDDGIRRVYIEGQHIKADVKAAVKASGAKGLEVGGYLKITFTHREDPMDKRSRKFWTVEYTPAGNAALMGDAVQENGTATSGDYHAAPVSDPNAGLKGVLLVRQLLDVPGLTDAQIAATAGVSAGDVAIVRAQLTDSPPF